MPMDLASHVEGCSHLHADRISVMINRCCGPTKRDRATSRAVRTYSRVEFSSTDVGKDGDVDGKRNTERKSDVKELANVWRFIGARCKFTCAGCVESDLCAGEGEGKEHEGSDELAQEGCSF